MQADFRPKPNAETGRQMQNSRTLRPICSSTRGSSQIFMYTHTLLNFKRPPGRRPRRTECKIHPRRVEAPRSHLHFVVQLLEAAVLPRHGELGALQDGLAAGHVAVDLREVHVEPGRRHRRHTRTNSARRRGQEKQTAATRSELSQKKCFNSSTCGGGCHFVSPAAGCVVCC